MGCAPEITQSARLYRGHRESTRSTPNILEGPRPAWLKPR